MNRYIVQLSFIATFLVSQFWALLHADGAIYTSTNAMQRLMDRTDFVPSWQGAITYGNQIWVWSSLIVLLLDKRRRAIHDFIARTVVVRKEYAQLSSHPEPVESASAP